MSLRGMLKADSPLYIKPTAETGVPQMALRVLEGVQCQSLHSRNRGDRQSEQTHYQKYVDQLLSEGKAYYAFDTSEELDIIRKRYSVMHKVFSYSHSTRMSTKNSLSLSADEVERLLKEVPYVIRFKVPSGVDVVFEDLIRGNIKISSDTLDDKVLFKSDGLPAYHLANIVDDHIIGTTHVIRGEEWISSCPLHILLHEASWF